MNEQDFRILLSLGTVFLSTFLAILVTSVNGRRTKSSILRQVLIELRSLARHFEANVSVIENTLSSGTASRIDIKKLKTDEVFLKTISLPTIHSLRITKEVLLDILQAVLVVRNCDLVIAEYIEQHFSATKTKHQTVYRITLENESKKDLESIKVRFSNLAFRIRKLETIVLSEKRRFLFFRLSNDYIPVWKRDISDLHH